MQIGPLTSNNICYSCELEPLLRIPARHESTRRSQRQSQAMNLGVSESGNKLLFELLKLKSRL